MIGVRKMNLSRFRKFCRMNAYALQIFSIFIFIAVVYSMYVYVSGTTTLSFSYKSPDITLFSVGGSKGAIGITEGERKTAAFTMIPIAQAVTIFVLLEGSAAFKWLADGKRPFDFNFVKIIKRISLTLMISDIILPLVHSFVLGVISVDGYNLNFGFGSGFIMGVILYVVSEIFNYGIELQNLSDDVV